MARRSCIICTLITLTIHIANITATEYVTVAIGNTCSRTYLTAMDMHFRLSEHVTIGIEFVSLTIFQFIVSLTATEHVTMHMAVVHLDICASMLPDNVLLTLSTCRLLSGSTSYGGNLTTAEETVTDITAPDSCVGEVASAQIVVASTKCIAAVFQTILTYTISLSLVVEFLLEIFISYFYLFFFIGLFILYLDSLGLYTIIVIANIAVVDGQVGCAKDRATLATTIGIELDGGYTVVIAIVIRHVTLIFTDANDDIGIGQNIIIGV